MKTLTILVIYEVLSLFSFEMFLCHTNFMFHIIKIQFLLPTSHCKLPQWDVYYKGNNECFLLLKMHRKWMQSKKYSILKGKSVSLDLQTLSVFHFPRIGQHLPHHASVQHLLCSKEIRPDTSTLEFAHSIFGVFIKIGPYTYHIHQFKMVIFKDCFTYSMKNYLIIGSNKEFPFSFLQLWQDNAIA